MPNRIITDIPKRLWYNGPVLTYCYEKSGKRHTHMKAIHQSHARDCACILLHELVSDMKYRDAVVYINGTPFTPSAKEAESFGYDPSDFGLEGTRKKKERKAAERKAVSLETEDVSELIAKLKMVTDSKEKKRIRRALRKAGHTGGAGSSAPVKSKKSRKGK